MTEEEVVTRMAEAREVFDKFDADGSGSIDASELKDALDAADVDVSPEEVATVAANSNRNNIRRRCCCSSNT